tara:strand:- start:280 stop:705 length:426 start_codon:yes stop_codon:yes gene_type:complete
MIIKQDVVIKIITTSCLIAAGFGPALIDIGDTHIFNPDWDEHARVHEVWRISTNIFISLIGIYLIWFKNKSLLPSILSMSLILGFFVSVFTMPLYEGLPIGVGVVEHSPYGIPLNILSFSIIGLIQIISIILIHRAYKKSN